MTIVPGSMPNMIFSMCGLFSFDDEEAYAVHNALLVKGAQLVDTVLQASHVDACLVTTDLYVDALHSADCQVVGICRGRVFQQ